MLEKFERAARFFMAVLCGRSSAAQDQNGAGDHALFPAEAEAMIQELKPMGVAEIGSERCPYESAEDASNHA